MPTVGGSGNGPGIGLADNVWPQPTSVQFPLWSAAPGEPPFGVTVQNMAREVALSVSAGPSSGQCQGSLIYLPNMLVTNLIMDSVVASVGATHSFYALYKITDLSTSTNVLLGQTADGGAVQIPATTLNIVPLTTPVAVQNGAYYVANSQTFGTSAASFVGYAPATHELKNRNPAMFINGTATGGGATAPASLAGAISGSPFWVGVS